jgi:hypothetical protein
LLIAPECQDSTSVSITRDDVRDIHTKVFLNGGDACLLLAIWVNQLRTIGVRENVDGSLQIQLGASHPTNHGVDVGSRQLGEI